jgi:tetratricopeptide (TPR) repeat protein
VQGVSLLPLGRGERLELLGFSETWYPRYHYGWSELTAVRDGRYKFIAAPRRELYDTHNDPGETTDLSGSNARLADALETALRDIAARTAVAATPQTPRAIEPEVEDRLRALGYVGASVSRAALADRSRGDPKDMIGLYNLLKLAGHDSVRGKLDDGIAKIRKVLAADPEVIEAHTMLGNMHIKAGRPRDAIAAYRQALAVDPEHEGATWSLALAYRQAGQIDEARAGFERLFELNPRGRVRRGSCHTGERARPRRRPRGISRQAGRGADRAQTDRRGAVSAARGDHNQVRSSDGPLQPRPGARSAAGVAGGRRGVRGGDQGEPAVVRAAFQSGQADDPRRPAR